MSAASRTRSIVSGVKRLIAPRMPCGANARPSRAGIASGRGQRRDSSGSAIRRKVAMQKRSVIPAT